MLKRQDNGVSLLTTVRKKPEDTGKILGLVFPGLWHSVHIDDLRRSTVMVSDITKLQDVAISLQEWTTMMATAETVGALAKSEGSAIISDARSLDHMLRVLLG